jgi:hypothetical protein
MMTSTPALEITPSRHFTNWMLEQKLSLSFTTYQARKLFPWASIRRADVTEVTDFLNF